MRWDAARAHWPNADLSRFVETRTHLWHVQRTGTGPGILLLHGAGASGHSWRDLVRPLAARADVLSLDLPGHGFTATHARGRSGLKPMAEDVASLLDAEAMEPDLIVGHSAGAAIALEMKLSGQAAPSHILGLNPALVPFQGLAGVIFPPLAKLLALNPLTAPVFARTASNRTAVRNLIEGTGSRIGDEGLALYRELISDPAHVDGALRMMASWDLNPLLRALPDLTAPATFAIGLKDRAVPPASTRDQAGRMQNARIIEYPELGHVMHEEQPAIFVDLIVDLLGSGA